MEYNIEPSEEEKNDWHNDPNNWVWGLFYYNPKDNRLLCPKRIKQLGLTINFGNPNSVFFAVILILTLYLLSFNITVPFITTSNFIIRHIRHYCTN
ncbi:hypothetical protein B0A67_09770 [Flavobacterium aquidurense]|nr:hypothetical protein B0A67_09770 [Flavobacterium aquidurense]SHH54253.1 hypothetical protein SAMN05444481_11947 [Flavobacterium frigidimaris]